MASNEKDRLGDKLRDKERAQEEAYFGARDRELIEKMRGQTAAAGMRCPKCSEALRQVTYNGVVVEECPGCRGMWLDHGELQGIAGHEKNGWIARWLRREFEKPE